MKSMLTLTNKNYCNYIRYIGCKLFKAVPTFFLTMKHCIDKWLILLLFIDLKFNANVLFEFSKHVYQISLL